MSDKKIGVFDPEGINNNPLTDKPYSDKYKELALKWTKLPIYKRANEIVNKIKNNQVTMILSSTGSGKSVLTPLLALAATDYQKKIAMTLPKQIITKSLGQYIALLTDTQVGEEIGYKYRNVEKGTYGTKTKLLFTTDGTILSELRKDPLLTKYDVILIDELHERSTNMDLLIFLLKNVLAKRPDDFKLILMSATIDEKLFSSYFAEYNYTSMDVGGERLYDIESIFLKDPISVNDYLDSGYEIIKKILKEDDVKQPGYHDILFFIPSVADAINICRRCNEDKLDLYCIELCAGVNHEKEELAVSKTKYKQYGNKGRKLVMSTNVAESSLTVDGVKYVIESGVELSSFYDPEIDARVLNKQYITNAQAKQRAGRAGRTAPGVCYHLYTKNDFENKFIKFPEPKIRTSNMYQDFLSLMNYPEFDTIEKLLNTLTKFIEPPRESYIRASIHQLKYLGLIDNEKITKFGKIINTFQMDPMFAVAIYVARLMKCSNEVLLIMSTIETSKSNINDLFVEPKFKQHGGTKNNDPKQKFFAAKRKFENKNGDHLSIYEIISKYSTLLKEQNEDKLRDFIHTHFLNKKTLDKSYTAYKRYKLSLQNTFNDINEIESLKDVKLDQKVLSAIAFGFKSHMGYLKDKTYSTNKVDKVKLSKNSFIDLRDMPKILFYNELFSSNGRLEINIASKVTPKIEETMSIINEHIQEINS